MKSVVYGQKVIHPQFEGVMKVCSPVFKNSFGDLCCEIRSTNNPKDRVHTVMLENLSEALEKEKPAKPVSSVKPLDSDKNAIEAFRTIARRKLATAIAKYSDSNGMMSEQEVAEMLLAEPLWFIELIAVNANIPVMVK